MNIGFIGLGVMGKPMAKNLLKAGYSVYAYDVVEANVKNVAEAGAVACASITEVCENCRDISPCCPTAPMSAPWPWARAALLRTLPRAPWSST